MSKKITIIDASVIFHILNGEKDAEARANSFQIKEAREGNYIPAATFGEFLLRNQIRQTEEVHR